ncbi:caspase-like [Episyrphus balteatus]|uniref:caspase-like n=1 Tax=Episyrphus balteatus TaxID=286459 RepID=UPI0024866A7E|nr:caspase-like [Episyrphus balteatus]
MFWKKSKDKDKSKNTTTTIYRTDGGFQTSSGSAITSFESKYKSTANSSSTKTKITISSSQTISQKQEFSSQITRTLRELEPKSGGSALSLMDSSSKWGAGAGAVSKQKAILPPRQKTEPSIVRRIDATPFSSKYESPYRNANLPTLRTPLLPAGSSSSVTTVTTTYQSPYRATSVTSSMREKKTSSSSSPFGPAKSINTTSKGLFSSSPKTKTTSTIWNPMSSIENAKPTSNPTWNKVSILTPKSSNTSSSPGPMTFTAKPTSSYPVSFTSNPQPQPSTSLLKTSVLPSLTQTTSAPSVVKKKQSPGVVHIFHNDKFDSPDKEFRIGSIEDVRLLKKTFQAFKMQVNLYENLTVKQVEDKVRKIELKDYANASCIVVVILTHGTRYETVAAKDGSYSIDDTVLFPILRNRSLRSKPKLLFIQACKGSMEPGKFHKDAIQPNGTPDEILKCYSTFEGYVAYRTEKGSLFIQSLCELLQTHGKTKNIKDIMDMVIRNVKIKSGSVQIPSYETTLTEPYVFGDFI